MTNPETTSEESHGINHQERDVEDVVNYDVASGHDLEPHAAERVDSGQCEYEDCDSDADYLVEVEKHGDTIGAFLCCQDCSSRNRIYAKENDLLDFEVSPEVRRDD